MAIFARLYFALCMCIDLKGKEHCIFLQTQVILECAESYKCFLQLKVRFSERKRSIQRLHAVGYSFFVL